MVFQHNQVDLLHVSKLRRVERYQKHEDIHIDSRPWTQLVLLLNVLATAAAAAEAELGLLLGVVVVADVQAEVAGLLGNLLERELGHVLGHGVGALALDVSAGVDDVDFLELTASRLDVEVPAEGNGAEVDESEEEVDTPRTGGGKDGREHDDSEVADPVGAGGGGTTGGTGTQGVDLGRVDPGERQQGKGEEDNEQEDTNDGTLGVGLGLLDQAGEGNDETETLAQETDQVEVTTTDTLNHEERGDGGQSVDGGEDTTHNQGQTVFQAQVVLEEQSRVVDGSVATGELLEELTGATDDHALELLGLAESEERLEAGLGGLGGLGGLDIGLHEVEVGQDVVGVGRGVLELGEDLASLRVVSSHHQPARRLGEHEGAGHDEQGEQDLQSDGESPLHGGLDVGETEDDPVGHESADGDNGTLEADEETTVVRAGALGLPDGDRRRVQTVTNSRHDTSDDELTETPLVAKGGRRDDGTDNQSKGTQDNQTRPTQGVTEEHGEESTEETTDLVTGGDGTTNDVDVSVRGSVGILGHLEGIEGLGELGTGDQTRHHALVVTEERETHDGGEGDAHPERSPRQAGGGSPHIAGTGDMRTREGIKENRDGERSDRK